MTTTPDFRAELARLVDLYYALGGNWSPHGYTDTWNDALANARAALATPPPLAPNYIDPEHHGEDRELLQVFYAACNAEGGTADEIHLRGIKAVMAAPAALATSPPTDDDLIEIARELRKTAEYLQLGCGWNKALRAIVSAVNLIESDLLQRLVPPPGAPTDEELWEIWNNHDGPIPVILRAALERWGR